MHPSPPAPGRARGFRRLITPGALSLLCAALVAGCGEKPSTSTGPETHSVDPPASPPLSAAAPDWVAMEPSATAAWQPIPGATEAAWDEQNRLLRLGIGNDLNGVRWTGPPPTPPYTVELEARRVSGSDFFCGLTFPVRSATECVTLVIGGWGGCLVGISSIDGLDASENSTGSRREFEDQRWYRIRVQVENEHLQAWIDDEQVVDLPTEGHQLALRPGPIEECAPFGLATWMTAAEVRGVRWRKSPE